MYSNMHEQMITHVIQVLCGFLLTHLFFFWLFFSHTRWIYKSLLFSPTLPCFLTRTSRSIFLILTLIWPRAPVLCFLCLYGWDLNQSLLVQCMLFIFLQFKEIVQRDAMWTTWLLDLCKLFGHSVPTSRIPIRAKGTFVKVQVLIRPVSKIDIPVYPKGVSNSLRSRLCAGHLCSSISKLAKQCPFHRYSHAGTVKDFPQTVAKRLEAHTFLVAVLFLMPFSRNTWTG